MMSGIIKYRKKPVIIEAIRLENNQQEIIDWSVGVIRKGLDGGLIIPTLEGDMIANTGSYIIRGVQGEYYPCKDDIFEMTYEPVLNTNKKDEKLEGIFSELYHELIHGDEEHCNWLYNKILEFQNGK